MRYYVLASSAWNAKVSKSNYEAVGSDPGIFECEASKAVIEESKRRMPILWRPTRYGEAGTIGIVIGGEGVPALWSCASDKIVEAEKLVAGEKR